MAKELLEAPVADEPGLLVEVEPETVEEIKDEIKELKAKQKPQPKQVSTQNRTNFAKKEVPEGWKEMVCPKSVLWKYVGVPSPTVPGALKYEMFSEELIDTGDPESVLLIRRIADIKHTQDENDQEARGRVVSITKNQEGPGRIASVTTDGISVGDDSGEIHGLIK